MVSLRPLYGEPETPSTARMLGRAVVFAVIPNGARPAFSSSFALARESVRAERHPSSLRVWSYGGARPAAHFSSVGVESKRHNALPCCPHQLR
jgi:hypothetical protein